VPAAGRSGSKYRFDRFGKHPASTGQAKAEAHDRAEDTVDGGYAELRPLGRSCEPATVVLPKRFLSDQADCTRRGGTVHCGVGGDKPPLSAKSGQRQAVTSRARPGRGNAGCRLAEHPRAAIPRVDQTPDRSGAGGDRAQTLVPRTFGLGAGAHTHHGPVPRAYGTGAPGRGTHRRNPLGHPHLVLSPASFGPPPKAGSTS